MNDLKNSINANIEENINNELKLFSNLKNEVR